MQNRYIVTYDITEDARRTSIYKTLRGFGDHLQYSVFRCDLSERRRTELTGTLHDLIDHATDQILIIDLGPIDGRASTCISSLGRGYTNPERTVVIL
ncbi:MAG TPA: CRISPR-associated endonuclease Cas2 [Kofleriaceae bacterium]|nr:CRISPR-associated endonuclease Cas2 [Kofleriaceae bacterium]